MKSMKAINGETQERSRAEILRECQGTNNINHEEGEGHEGGDPRAGSRRDAENAKEPTAATIKSRKAMNGETQEQFLAEALSAQGNPKS